MSVTFSEFLSDSGSKIMASKPEPAALNQDDLGYLQLPVIDMGANYREPEAYGVKMKRKLRENPLVPIGLGVTIFALTYGIYQMKTGDKIMSQRMMRLRVAAQGFTVIAMLGGMLYQANKSKMLKKT